MSLHSGAGSGEEGLLSSPNSVGRALVLFGLSASNTGAQDVGE